jgi:hypothetical protein
MANAAREAPTGRTLEKRERKGPECKSGAPATLTSFVPQMGKNGKMAHLDDLELYRGTARHERPE